MKTILFTASLLWLMVFPFLCEAQISSTMTDKKVKQEKKWMVAWSFGRTLNSPGKDLENAMKNSSLGDRTPLVRYTVNLFGFTYDYTSGGDQYPLTTSNRKYMDLHVTYYATPKSGLSIRYSEAPRVKVTGFDRHGDAGNFLTIKTKGAFVTFDYILRTGIRNSGLSVGPTLAFRQVAQESNENPETAYHHKSVQPGLHMGYELAVINSKYLFFGLNLNYNWSFKEHIGEIKVGDPAVYTSVFKSAAVKLDNFNLGITVGIKL